MCLNQSEKSTVLLFFYQPGDKTKPSVFSTLGTPLQISCGIRAKYWENCTLVLAIYNICSISASTGRINLSTNAVSKEVEVVSETPYPHLDWQRCFKQIPSYTFHFLLAQWTPHEFHIWDFSLHVFIKDWENMKEIFLVQRKAESAHGNLEICDGHKAIAQLVQLFEGSPECLEVWNQLQKKQAY